MALTEHERQILIAELCEVTDELIEIFNQLDVVHRRTAELVERVASQTVVRLERPA
jgi:hypothetical protein